MGGFFQRVYQMKVLSIFGTRPEAIKMAIIVKKLNEDPEFDHKICVTSQHKEMLQQVLDFFQISTDYDFNIMSDHQDLANVTCSILKNLNDLFKDYLPDLVLVQGDTSTCFAGALASFYHKIKVGHVEAGLRTGNLHSPFPEEVNRVLVSRIASYHFAPTESNVGYQFYPTFA